MAVAFGRASVALLIVAVPVAAPRFNAVAAPPRLSVVRPELSKSAVGLNISCVGDRYPC